MLMMCWMCLIKLAIIGFCSLCLVTPSFADIAVIVHPDNPTSQLTKKQVKRLFLGRLHMLPNTKVKAKVVDQDEGELSYEYFYSNVVRMDSSKLKRYRAAYLFSGKGVLPLKLKDDLAVRSHVASHPEAIGYVDSTLVDSSVKNVFVFGL